jgi:hypothetical protein
MSFLDVEIKPGAFPWIIERSRNDIMRIYRSLSVVEMAGNAKRPTLFREKPRWPRQYIFLNVEPKRSDEIQHHR